MENLSESPSRRQLRPVRALDGYLDEGANSSEATLTAARDRARARDELSLVHAASVF